MIIIWVLSTIYKFCAAYSIYNTLRPLRLISTLFVLTCKIITFDLPQKFFILSRTSPRSILYVINCFNLLFSLFHLILPYLQKFGFQPFFWLWICRIIVNVIIFPCNFLLLHWCSCSSKGQIASIKSTWWPWRILYKKSPCGWWSPCSCSAGWLESFRICIKFTGIILLQLWSAFNCSIWLS